MVNSNGHAGNPSPSSIEDRILDGIAQAQRSAPSTVFVLLAYAHRAGIHICELGRATDAIRIFLDIIENTESWKNPYWLTDPSADSEQARHLIEQQTAVMQAFLADLKAVDGLEFALAWPIDGEDNSEFHHHGLDQCDALEQLADRLADELRFLAM